MKKYNIVILDEAGFETNDYSNTKEIHEWKLSTFKEGGVTIIRQGLSKNIEEANSEDNELITGLFKNGFEQRVQSLVNNNSVIGHESTLNDVLYLFQEFNIGTSDSEQKVRTYVINRVLGGEQK